MDIATDLERYMLELVNAERVANGLDRLVLEQNLNSAADAHSQWISETDTFSHTGVGGSSPTQRMRDADADFAGSWRTAENIAAVSMSGAAGAFYDEVDRLHANLMDSPGHRANILRDDVEAIGIGIHVGALTYGSGRSWPSVIVTQKFFRTEGDLDLDLAGNGAANRLTGGTGDDHILGGGGNDTIVTGTGDDTVRGDSGNDRIEAGTGTKSINGGAGRDTLAIDAARSDVSAAVEGGILSITGSGFDLRVQNVETVEFADGSVAVSALGTPAPPSTPPEPSPPAPPDTPHATVHRGTSAAERIEGGSGKDLLAGAGGSDTLVSADGDDIFIADDRGLYGTDESAQVFRLYAAIFGREPDAAGHQQWLKQLATGAMDIESVTAAFVASPEFQSTYSDTSNSAFVELLYQNVFGRVPAAHEVIAWTNNITNGMPREEVVRHFADGAEHQIRSKDAQEAFDAARDPTQWADDVFRLYQAVLNRDPDAGGFNGWIANLANGTQDFEAVVAGFMASPEFQNTYGATTNAQFVTLLYENVLNRAPDSAGLLGWTGNIDRGMSREDVVQHFMASVEFVNGTEAALTAFVKSFGPDDRLEAGAGDSVMSGGLYADTFVFEARDDGTHEITDFEAWDTLSLAGFGYATETEALAHFTQFGDDAVFAHNGVTVVLKDWDETLLTEAMIDIA